MKNLLVVRGTKKMKKLLTVITIVLVAGIGVIYYCQKLEKGLLNYVTIDINPSVQLALNSNKVVVGVIALNDDADILTSDLKLVGLSIEDATKLVLESATESGYIEEYGEDNYVTITAYSDNEKLRNSIEDIVVENAKKVLEDKKIYSQVVSNGVTTAMKEQAEEYNVSNGKMLLVEKAYALNNSLDKTELANASIKEIQEKIKLAVQTRYDQKEMNKEDFKQFAKEQKEIRIQENAAKTNEIIEELSNQNTNLIKDVTGAAKDKIIEELLEKKKIEINNRITNNDASVDDNGNTSDNQSNTGTDTSIDQGNTSSGNQGTNSTKP